MGWINHFTDCQIANHLASNKLSFNELVVQRHQIRQRAIQFVPKLFTYSGDEQMPLPRNKDFIGK